MINTTHAPVDAHDIERLAKAARDEQEFESPEITAHFLFCYDCAEQIVSPRPESAAEFAERAFNQKWAVETLTVFLLNERTKVERVFCPKCGGGN